MTSSLRNSLHRRNHKERSQLAHREKLGFLEKHKDYVKRARDYHSKQDRLQRLRQKAAERNKDEFYFSMNREKTKGGVHIKDRGNVAIPTDIVKVLKTQDENYVRTMRLSNLKKIDKLKRQLTEMADLFKSSLGDDSTQGLEDEEYEILQETGIIPSSKKRKRSSRHVVFAESLEEAQSMGRKADSAPEPEDEQASAPQNSSQDLGWTVVESKKKKKARTRPQVVVDVQDDMDEDESSSSSTHKRTRLLKELGARLIRDRQLRYTTREFEMQRLMMGKGATQKISGVEKVGNEDDEDSDDEDALDARGGRRSKKSKTVDEATYKPRVYKWKLERKK
ncbi:u3 small nucleolar RNA-associated protein 11 [Coprinopsis sp. MPI-PUGE-AT-0042]|nr:u3 small nucleolar RNA-associated protein 11 [Coprinopsis sp. MPI-PUGE-AT-0042]